MAGTLQASKPSKWGSLLQQAVAGVESRLDTILAEGDESTRQPSRATATQAQPPARSENMSATAHSEPSISRAENGTSRTRSNSKVNDRLQERLARAMVSRDRSRDGRSHTSSRAASPALGSQSQSAEANTHGKSLDASGQGTINATNGTPPTADATEAMVDQMGADSMHNAATSQSQLDKSLLPSTTQQANAFEASSASSSRAQSQQPSVTKGDLDQRIDNAANSVSVVIGSGTLEPTSETYETVLEQLRSDYEVSELQRQEEVHLYTERIDALQAKLQYLSKEVAESAKNAATVAPAGSLEKKLAEKEEQIALLMDEGQELSKQELKHMNTIKKLRAKVLDSEKQLSETNTKRERAEKDTADLKEKLRRAEAAEKRASEKQRALSKMEKTVEELNAQRERDSELIKSLRSQLTQVATKAADESKETQKAELEAAKRQIANLSDELSSAKVQKELSEERAQGQIRGLRQKLETERQLAKNAELELREEQSMLESKMEILRARAEEVTMAASGDSQAKLFRQVETLQTQYAVASENWQRIEETLMTRITNLEKERDDLLRKEQEVRRKARDVNTKAKRNEAELETTINKLHNMERDLAEQQAQVESLRGALQDAEANFKCVEEEMEQKRRIWEAELPNHIEEEKIRWREDEAAAIAALTAQIPSPYLRPDIESRSPLSRKGSDLEYLNSPDGESRSWTRSIASTRRVTHNPSSRRNSNQRPLTPKSITPLRKGSIPSSPRIATNGSAHEVLPGYASDQTGMNDSPSSPHETLKSRILISTSKSEPPVKLIEHLVTALQELDAESTVLKEDIAQLIAQRDEARKEVIALMQQVEQKRAVDERLKQLENDLVEINERYETTLEMLGEKTELVEELRADVDDLKKIYRDLLDSTIK